MFKRWNLVAMLSLLLSPVALAETNWPNWRGPNNTGAVDSASAPIEWGPDKNILWKADIPGKGSSTPIVWGNQVFVLTAIKTDRQGESKSGEAAPPPPPPAQPAPPPGGEAPGGGRRPPPPPPTNIYQFVILSYDLKTGKKIWESVATEEVPHEAGHGTNNFASSSPVTDGKFLYAYFGSRGVFAYDLQGNKKWERDLGQQTTRNQFGEGGSPALYRDTLVVPWDHEGQSFIAAFNALNGEILWKVDRDEKTGWSTPLIVEHKGRVQVVTNGKRVRSYDLKDGKLIWECSGQTDNPIPTPILYGDHVIATTGFRGANIFSISLDAVGDVTNKTSSVLWQYTKGTPYVPSPVLYKDQLYFVKSNEPILTSLDAKTGDVLIDQKRLDGVNLIYSSFGAAGDHIYVTSRDGTTKVLKHGHELNVVATNKLEEEIDASPVFIDSKLLLRSEKHLFLIGKQP